ncbi:UDP-N-acetylmuramoyl-L-alanyl-D-glutamate--2,6-diaminopimelate ligase [Schaalia sp. ZJ405]|uniref:UDP-N-acetylmuramoyl-L-alanyl-D-glutamate--2, 6-diaminopimelate ligase n=1 Tax=Schaalia sp. ZJ405 TaxID=2709403 RepID=UPI0013ECC7CD|nr:UDP-N-acetylmuramoyl-L-alanyl-D-glutamate--2,6-diaminopimelate ligase [Schaalia sp. ZJ405]QPK80458.1 UDP-N-acetylmuramoyl-L-alanyl-D-glutamate--2,6-diaminopimelate ligase [Schaalia sp. ZJ405]
MTSVTDIRPTAQPLALDELLKGVSVECIHVPRVGRIEDVTDAAVKSVLVSGVTVATDDCEPGWGFVAIAGLKHHGAEFSQKAVDVGAVVIITDSDGVDAACATSPRVPVVVVDDPRRSAAVLAANMYRKPARDLVTMAITGTNGKTTTSYLMRAAIASRYPKASLCGTIETSVGSVRFLSSRTTAESPVIERFLALTREENCGAAIIETSSHAMSLNRVDGIVFDVAGFTNLQHDHLDYYGDFENYFLAKKQLFTPEHSRQGVVCVDDQWGQRLAREASVPVTTVSALTDHPADWTVKDIHADTRIGRLVFTLVDPDGTPHLVRMPILGEVNVQNSAVAIIAAVQLGFPLAEVIDSYENAPQIPGRMQKINERNDAEPLVLVDYAHTPEALEWTLRSARQLTSGTLHIVFGTDGDRDPSKREKLAAVAAAETDILWVTDENPRFEDPQSIRDQLLRGVRSVRPALDNVHEVLTCRRDAVRRAIFAAQPGDTVMVTGKGPEWYQDIEGVKHVYSDIDVSREVLHYYGK